MVTAVVLGGLDINGGRGAILGVVLALFLLGTMRNGMGLANVAGPTQTIVLGGLLIVGVLRPIFSTAPSAATSSPRLDSGCLELKEIERTQFDRTRNGRRTNTTAKKEETMKVAKRLLAGAGMALASALGVPLRLRQGLRLQDHDDAEVDRLPLF